MPQMRRMYSSTSRQVRIAEYRQAATECDAKGFSLFADLNRECAATLALAERESKRERTEINSTDADRNGGNR